MNIVERNARGALPFVRVVDFVKNRHLALFCSMRSGGFPGKSLFTLSVHGYTPLAHFLKLIFLTWKQWLITFGWKSSLKNAPSLHWSSLFSRPGNTFLSIWMVAHWYYKWLIFLLSDEEASIINLYDIKNVLRG